MSGSTVADVGFSSSFAFSAIAIKPSNFDRLSSLCTSFELYRFVHLSATIMPAPSGAKPVACAFFETTTSPSGLNYISIGDMANAAFWFPGETRPVRVSHRVHNQQTWKRTTDGDGVTGYMVTGTDSSTGLVCWARISYTIQFKTPMATGKPSVGCFGKLIDRTTDAVVLSDGEFDEDDEKDMDDAYLAAVQPSVALRDRGGSKLLNTRNSTSSTTDQTLQRKVPELPRKKDAQDTVPASELSARTRLNVA